MIKQFRIKFPTPEGEEFRRAYVYLPTSYMTHKRKRFPVLYMFDGHNVFFDDHATFGKSWGMFDYMERTHTPCIIAAVECNHHPDNGRLKEYAPFSFKDSYMGPIEGLGEITMDWFVNVFKKRMDRNYRTLSDREHTFIAGSSMGGLMSVYALTAYNHIFSRAAALSPSLWTAPSQLIDLIKHADLAPDTVLYMDYGSEELSNHKGMLKAYSQFASLFLQKGVMLNCRIVPNGSHCEASWEKQISFFMHTLLYELP